VVIGKLVAGEKSSGQVNNVEAPGTFGAASLGLMTECVAEGPMTGADVLDGVECFPWENRWVYGSKDPLDAVGRRSSSNSWSGGASSVVRLVNGDWWSRIDLQALAVPSPITRV